jgi:hypothetical protein
MQRVKDLLDSREQSADSSPEYVMVVPGGAASRATGGVLAGGGGASPRHVVVTAFVGLAQLISPFTVIGIHKAKDLLDSREQSAD